MTWPLLLGLLVLAVFVIAGTWISIRNSEGHFVYGLDDAYIHMAVARNFVVHGVWGVTRYSFSSSTSSLLWPALLAGVAAVAGEHTLTPLVLNMVFAVATVLVVYYILRVFQLRPVAIAAVLLSVITLTPLPVLILSGMEHVLHIFVTLTFAYVAARTLSPDAAPSPGRAALLPLLAAAAVATRYETLAGVVVVTLLLFWRRRWGLGVLTASLAVAPIAAFGFVSVQQGWAFLPNPILLKSVVPNFSTLGGAIRMLGLQSVERMVEAPHILALVLASLIAYISCTDDCGWWQDTRLVVLIFVTSTLAHMQFGGVGWQFRYEAYLMALGIVATAANLSQLRDRRGKHLSSPWRSSKAIAMLCLAGLLAAPILTRGVQATREMGSGRYFYHTTYQMSRFVDSWHRGEAIAVNDIGAVNYFADCRCVDVAGLGTFEIVRRPRHEPYRTTIDRLARDHNVKLAILSIWFPSKHASDIPDRWRWIGKWVFEQSEIWFYAVDERWEADIREHFERFSPRLPRRVQATTARTADGAGMASAKH